MILAKFVDDLVCRGEVGGVIGRFLLAVTGWHGDCVVAFCEVLIGDRGGELKVRLW